VIRLPQPTKDPNPYLERTVVSQPDAMTITGGKAATGRHSKHPGIIEKLE
jgi:hypothetical protein